MQNTISEDYNATDLIEENPYNNGQQAPIYLVIDWEAGTVDAEVHYGDGVPESIWNGRATRIKLPNSIDASLLHDDVEDLMNKINEIATGYETVWNGSNWIGSFTGDARADLDELERKIEQDGHSLFSGMESGGLWDVVDWIQDNPDEITSETTDDELRDIADSYIDDARSSGVVISGGRDAVTEHFTEIRDRLIEEQNDE